MPLRSRYSRRPVNRAFTNREKHIDHFRRQVDNLERGQHYILTYYGVGGQGKSALCKKFQEELKTVAAPNCFGHVDFQAAECQRADKALLQLRRSLRVSGKIRFTAFDIALGRYWEIS
ncbi:MAG: hypothetical protein ABSB19_12175 [Methylomonas sp.]|jgi:hypothetical protein